MRCLFRSVLLYTQIICGCAAACSPIVTNPYLLARPITGVHTALLIIASQRLPPGGRSPTRTPRRQEHRIELCEEHCTETKKKKIENVTAHAQQHHNPNVPSPKANPSFPHTPCLCVPASRPRLIVSSNALKTIAQIFTHTSGTDWHFTKLCALWPSAQQRMAVHGWGATEGLEIIVKTVWYPRQLNRHFRSRQPPAVSRVACTVVCRSQWPCTAPTACAAASRQR